MSASARLVWAVGKVRARTKSFRRNEAEYLAFYEDPQRNRPPGSESLEEFGERVSDALQDVMTAHAKGTFCVIAHAGVIRAALGYVLQAAPVAWYRTRIDNAAFTRFLLGAYGLKMEFHNRPRLPADA